MSVRLELSNIPIEDYANIKGCLRYVAVRAYQKKDDPSCEVNCFLENIKDYKLDPYLYVPRAFYIRHTGDLSIEEKPTIDLQFSGKLRDEQVQVSNALIDMITTKKTAILEAPTGFGKTIFGIHMMCVLKKITIIITPMSETVKQWVDGILTHVEDMELSNIWVIGGSGDDRIPNMSKIKCIICYIERAVKVPQEIVDTIGFMIIDEIHACCAPTYMESILRFNPEYILGETATMQRDDYLHLVAQAIAGNSIVVKKELRFRFIIFNLEEIDIETPKMANGRPNYARMINIMLSNKDYLDSIEDFVRLNKKRKMLLLCDRVEACEVLNRRIRKLGIDCDFMHGSKKTFKNSQIIIATEKALGTGFDEAASKGWNGVRINCVARIGGGKSIPRFKQNLGRAGRSEDPMFVTFRVKNDIISNQIIELVKETNNNTKNKVEMYNEIVNLSKTPRQYAEILTSKTGR